MGDFCYSRWRRQRLKGGASLAEPREHERDCASCQRLASGRVLYFCIPTEAPAIPVTVGQQLVCHFGTLHCSPSFRSRGVLPVVRRTERVGPDRRSSWILRCQPNVRSVWTGCSCSGRGGFSGGRVGAGLFTKLYCRPAAAWRRPDLPARCLHLLARGAETGIPRRPVADGHLRILG